MRPTSLVLLDGDGLSAQVHLADQDLVACQQGWGCSYCFQQILWGVQDSQVVVPGIGDLHEFSGPGEQGHSQGQAYGFLRHGRTFSRGSGEGGVGSPGRTRRRGTSITIHKDVIKSVPYIPDCCTKP